MYSTNTWPVPLKHIEAEALTISEPSTTLLHEVLKAIEGLCEDLHAAGETLLSSSSKESSTDLYAWKAFSLEFSGLLKNKVFQTKWPHCGQ